MSNVYGKGGILSGSPIYGNGGKANGALIYGTALKPIPFKLAKSSIKAITGEIGAFIRATTATVEDHEGVIREVNSGEVRFQGQRRVENLVEEDFSIWAAASCTKDVNYTGVAAPDGTFTACRITSAASAVWTFNRNTNAGAANSSTIQSYWIKSNTGVSQTFRIQASNTAGAEVTATTEWQRVTDGERVITVGGARNYGLTRNIAADATDILVWHPQLQNKSGASDPTVPDSYCSTGVLSAPYHGANIDGVKYFLTDNGNSVASNIVIEAAGLPLNFTEETTNSCLWNRDFTNAIWFDGGLGLVQDQVGIDGKPSSAWTISDNNITFSTRITQFMTIPDDSSTHICSFFIKKVETTVIYSYIQIATAGGSTITHKDMEFNPETGELITLFSATTNLFQQVSLFTAPNGDKWWKIDLGLENNSTGNIALIFHIYPVGNTLDFGFGNPVGDGTGTGSIVIDAPQVLLNQTNPQPAILTEDKPVLRIPNIGRLAEGQTTNKCTNYNANPDSGAVADGTLAAFNAAGVTNVTASGGDGSSLYGVVDDAVKLATAGLGAICTSNIVLHINNTGSAARAVFNINGAADGNEHTISAQCRGDGSIHLSGRYGTSKQLFSSLEYERVIHIDTSNAAIFAMSVEPGDEAWIILNQLEYWYDKTTPVVVKGAAVIRHKEVCPYPLVHIPNNNYAIILKYNVLMTTIFSLYIAEIGTASDALAIYISAGVLYVRKTVGSVSHSATVPITVITNTLYDIRIRVNDITGIDIWLDKVKGTNNSNVENLELSSDLYVGSTIAETAQPQGGVETFSVHTNIITDKEILAL